MTTESNASNESTPSTTQVTPEMLAAATGALRDMLSSPATAPLVDKALADEGYSKPRGFFGAIFHPIGLLFTKGKANKGAGVIGTAGLGTTGYVGYMGGKWAYRKITGGGAQATAMLP